MTLERNVLQNMFCRLFLSLPIHGIRRKSWLCDKLESNAGFAFCVMAIEILTIKYIVRLIKMLARRVFSEEARRLCSAHQFSRACPTWSQQESLDLPFQSPITMKRSFKCARRQVHYPPTRIILRGCMSQIVDWMVFTRWKISVLSVWESIFIWTSRPFCSI